MRQIPYRLLAALTITLTLGGCVTYPAAPPVIGGNTYVRKAPPVYSYSVITDPGYRYYDDTLGVYVFYDRSDVFYRQGRYYRWYQDHWISASHWGGRWYPAPNFYISANFSDRWHTRLRRHGHRYAGGHDYRPPRRHGHDDGYKRRDWHDGNAHRDDRREKGLDRREKGWERRERGLDQREKVRDRREIVLDRREKVRDRREKGQDRGRGSEDRFAGKAEQKRRASQVDNRGGDRLSERGKSHRIPSRDERIVKVAEKPTSSRGPRVIPAVERPAIDRRSVRERPKPQTQRGQPQRNAPKDRRNDAAKPVQRHEREQPKNERPKKNKKEEEKKSKKKADKRDQVRRVREPHTLRSSEVRRRID
ncbi:hypothetical protein [Microbulbifer mangrovi]|uniref:hypothetical protein n=1 Tax=Microbulbifer mangrovi TaxID=927787 RepID=UPI00117E6186|nr:hypothetical protein [Microbulbifer mangrovi]